MASGLQNFVVFKVHHFGALLIVLLKVLLMHALTIWNEKFWLFWQLWWDWFALVFSSGFVVIEHSNSELLFSVLLVTRIPFSFSGFIKWDWPFWDRKDFSSGPRFLSFLIILACAPSISSPRASKSLSFIHSSKKTSSRLILSNSKRRFCGEPSAKSRPNRIIPGMEMFIKTLSVTLSWRFYQQCGPAWPPLCSGWWSRWWWPWCWSWTVPPDGSR